ncbi:MAG TPA: peptidylprolyl isomerase [Gammaproteobacteria bacterium]|nr:peptidylprolyl isomerase [Gammaproteobacteria bacterium]
MKIKHIAFCLAAALALAGCQQDKKPAATVAAGDVVAYVNKEPISKQMFEFHLERRTGGQPQLASAEDREALLKELVDMTLLAQEAERQGLTSKPEVAARLQNLRSAVLAQATVEEMLQQAPDDAALQAEYDKRFKGEQGQEYHARHILVDSKEKAEKIIAQLDKGADFGKLAEENSTDSTSSNGGDLGWFQPEQMVAPFAEAVQQLQPGAYSKEPVQTQFGWHIVKLEETRAVTPPPLDEVRQQLSALVVQERVETRIEELRKNADIRMQLPAQQEEAQPNQPATQDEEKPADSQESAHNSLNLLN